MNQKNAYQLEVLYSEIDKHLDTSNSIVFSANSALSVPLHDVNKTVTSVIDGDTFNIRIETIVKTVIPPIPAAELRGYSININIFFLYSYTAD